MRKKIRYALFLLLLVVLGLVTSYAWRAFPIITGYCAKNMASAIYLQHRSPEEVLQEDLGGFPFLLCSFSYHQEDSSVTASILGLARKKAIFRKGVGCTLLNGFSEAEVRQQRFVLPAAPRLNRDTIPWPYGDLLTDAVPAGVDQQGLQQAIRRAMTATLEGKPAYTRAVVVLYDGKIVGEQYAPGFSKETVMLGWSMSKSLTAALVGVLVREGKLDPDAPAPVPEWKGTEKEKIRLKHLLQQTSGLDFEEAYASPSEVTNMLFREGDMAAYTARLDLKHAPGTVFNYSSGNTNILSRIIRRVTGEDQYAAFPYTALFHKINMYSVLLEPDASGTYIGSSYSYATARDFARFGLLYLQNGRWKGEQVLPENWVKATIKPSAADPLQGYGYQFWLNGFNEANPAQRRFPDVPADLFYASGFGGQNIFIIPSKKLVVVRMGLQRIDGNRFLKEVLAAINE